MNQNEAENRKSNFTERRPSSTSFVTAWQIQSTIKNMLEFIKVIEQSQTQRTNLKSVLSHAFRVKKIDEEKDSLIKELKDLAKIGIPYQQGSKQSFLAKTQNKQKLIASNHQNRLKKVVKNLKQQTKMVEKQIKTVRQTAREAQSNLQTKRNNKKQNLVAQINSSLSSQINLLTDKIIEKQNSLNVESQKSIHESFIEQFISKRLLPERKFSQFMNSFSQNSNLKKSSITGEQAIRESEKLIQNQINFEVFKKDLQSIQIQIGEAKCKLLSLQDKKRKTTVQNLLANKQKKSKEVYGCNFDTIGSNKSIKFIKNQVKIQKVPSQQIVHQTNSKEKQKQSEGNFFTSFFSVFSNPSQQKSQVKAQQLTHQMQLPPSDTKLSRSSQQQFSPQNFQQYLQEVEDSQTKLRMIEINFQILELRQHINIMVNQNIFDQIIACVMKIKELNEELHPLLDKLIEVLTIFDNQASLKYEEFNMQLTPFQSPKSVSSRKLSLSKMSSQSVKVKLRENENMRFFMGIIDSNFKLRVRVVEKLFSSLQYSIKVVIRYLRRRFGQIREQYELFVENDTKDQKIKATQGVKCRTQVMLIGSVLQKLNQEINDLIESRLIRLDEIFTTEGESFRKYIEQTIRFVNVQKRDESQKIGSNDCVLNDSAESQALQKMILSSQKQSEKSMQDRKIGQKTTTVQIKEQINKRLFEFYDKLVTKIFHVFNLKC